MALRKVEKWPVKSFHKGLRVVPSRLLGWYDVHARSLPWRVGPAERAGGQRPDPYRVWLSEIMLQQTTIPHAQRYFGAFTARWPSVDALAAADDEDVMSAWAGLGYYARARNLLKCARQVSAMGGFPRTREGLQALPGIGPYTSGAIAAIAFDVPAPAVDGNVERVMARLMALKGDWKSEKARIAETVAALVPQDRPGEFAEALMDLGATVCKPKRPDCPACPLQALCAARAEGAPERYPVKPKRAKQAPRYGSVLVRTHKERVLVERRPDSGLLGGMWGLPTSDWAGEAHASRSPPPHAGHAAKHCGEIEHVFTHIRLRLGVFREAASDAGTGGDWLELANARASLPSVFVKALDLATGTQ